MRHRPPFSPQVDFHSKQDESIRLPNTIGAGIYPNRRNITNCIPRANERSSSETDLFNRDNPLNILFFCEISVEQTLKLSSTEASASRQRRTSWRTTISGTDRSSDRVCCKRRQWPQELRLLRQSFRGHSELALELPPPPYIRWLRSLEHLGLYRCLISAFWILKV